jgi:hypothetical protein
MMFTILVIVSGGLATQIGSYSTAEQCEVARAIIDSKTSSITVAPVCVPVDPQGVRQVQE